MGYHYEVLQRIAEFSARIRGRQLSNWRASLDSRTATCSHCGRAVTIHPSLMHPRWMGKPSKSTAAKSVAERRHENAGQPWRDAPDYWLSRVRMKARSLGPA